MCLTVKSRTKKCVAKNDILVYKCLDTRKNEKGKIVEYCTPFQYMPIKFDKNSMCSLNNHIPIESERIFGSNRYIVNRGFHAYRIESRANNCAATFPECGTTKFYAVIPKGAEYYIGNKGDIVSDSLIIFKTKEAYENYNAE